MKMLNNKLKNIYNNYKYSLYSGIIFSFITHLYYFTKRLGNEDDLSYLLFNDNALTSGRWYNGTLLSTSVMSPVIKYILIIILLSITSLLICDIFQINTKKNQILVSLILTTFPSLALSFSYLFMVEVYMISLLLGVLSLWVTTKYKYGLLAGSLFIALSLGCYQSYIGITVSLTILYIIKQIIEKQESKIVLKTIMKLLIMGILGVLIYFIILKILLIMNKTTLSSYKGANKMGLPPLSLWPTQIIRTYKHFIGYILGQSFFKVNIYETITRIILAIGTFYLLIINIINKKIIKDKLNFSILIILIILLPLEINIVDFMAYNTELTSLQIYQYSIFFVLPIILFNNTSKKYIINIISVFIIIYSYFNFITINKYYYKLETYYNYTVNFNNRLLTKIESTKGYKEGIPIMIVGNKNGTFYKELMNYPEINDNITFDQSLWGGKYIGYIELYTYDNDKKIFKMIKNQFGVELNRVTDEDRKKILDSTEYNNMSSYPDDNSIKIIDGILVVIL